MCTEHGTQHFQQFLYLFNCHFLQMVVNKVRAHSHTHIRLIKQENFGIGYVGKGHYFAVLY
jgi:hypothetical protein